MDIFRIPKRYVIKKNWSGSVVKHNKVYCWRFKNPTTGKYTRQVLRNESGLKVTSLPEAEAIVMKLHLERQRLCDLESKGEFLAKMAEIKGLIQRSKIKMSDLWGSYLANPNRPDSSDVTLKHYKVGLDLFALWLKEFYPGLQSISDITAEIVGEFSNHYWNTGVSERTYNARLGACKMVFKVLLGADNPFQGIRKKHEFQQSRKAFTIQQLQDIAATIDDPEYYMMNKTQMRLMMLTMLYTGCRGEDSCLMKWDHINLSTRIITYTPLKTAKKQPKPVVVPIADALLAGLQKALEWRTDQYVLPEVAERYLRNPCAISTDISKLLKRSGIQTTLKDPTLRRQKVIVQYSMHSFRHTFCTLSVNNGITLPVIQSIVGHTTAMMTSHYSHISLESKLDAVKTIPLLDAGTLRKPDFDFKKEMTDIPASNKHQLLLDWLDEHLDESQKFNLIASISGYLAQ